MASHLIVANVADTKDWKDYPSEAVIKHHLYPIDANIFDTLELIESIKKEHGDKLVTINKYEHLHKVL